MKRARKNRLFSGRETGTNIGTRGENRKAGWRGIK